MADPDMLAKDKDYKNNGYDICQETVKDPYYSTS